MNDHLRDRILRKLATLSDERGYQVLDYAEFLESRYAERQSPSNPFTRFAEGLEDKLRAGKVSATAIAETMGLMNRAASVLSDALATGRSMATDIVNATTSTTGTGSTGARSTPGSPPPAGNAPSTPPAPSTSSAPPPPPPTPPAAIPNGTAGAEGTGSSAAGTSSQQPPITGPTGNEEKL